MAFESLRDEIKFALTRQPGEERAAIDGEGHTIVKASSLEGQVPPAWVAGVHTLVETYRMGQNDQGFDDNGKPTEVVTGVHLLHLHQWVAHKVKQVDSTYEPGDVFIGRGKNARAIHASLTQWVASASVLA